MTCWYFTLSGILLYSDLTGKPDWMKQYKVQPGENQPVRSAVDYVIKLYGYLLDFLVKTVRTERNVNKAACDVPEM